MGPSAISINISTQVEVENLRQAGYNAGCTAPEEGSRYIKSSLHWGRPLPLTR
jgi:hypothetical protein